MSNPLFKYTVIVNDQYFVENRSRIKEWFRTNDSLWLWTCISRASHSNDYMVYFNDDTLLMLFKLSFDTRPVVEETFDFNNYIK